MPMALSGICWNYILIRCASSILWLCFCHSILHFVFFFRNFKSKRIANDYLNWKTGVLFSKLSKRSAWMMAKSGQTRQNLFLFMLKTSLTDLAIIGKKRNSIKLTLVKQGFFLLRKQFSFEFMFLSRSAQNIVSSIRITDRWILWLLERESCRLYLFVNAIQH